MKAERMRTGCAGFEDIAYGQSESGIVFENIQGANEAYPRERFGLLRAGLFPVPAEAALQEERGRDNLIVFFPAVRGPRAWSDCGSSLKRRTVFATSALLDVEYGTVVSVPHGFRPIESSEQPHARICDARLWTECDRERRLNSR
ncbi:hypothetical protein MRX96_039827 [Rhipicephalus microplus]